MEMGIFFAPEGADDLVTHAKMAEDGGYDMIGLGDSQSVFREVYVNLGILARETESIRLGPAVTNPITRHPVVTASAMATVDEISDGRAFIGIGSGDSAVHTLGHRPARLAEMEEYMTVVKTLFGADPIEYDDATVRLKWLERENQTRDVPVFLGAEGPKTLKLGGSVADAVFIGTGLSPDLIQDSVDKVNEGAREAGRDPDDIEKWVLAKANIGDEREEALDEIKMALAASANHAFRFTMEGKQVPEKYKNKIRTLKDEYVPHEHEELGDTRNRELVEELGLTQFLADRFAIVGTPEDCIAKLREIESVPAVDGVLMTAYTENKENFITKFSEDVLPEF